jgi:hypothetical protein
LHTLMTSLPALSRFLDSSEWTISSADFLGRGTWYVHGSTTDCTDVGADHPDLERFCDTPDSIDVFGEEVPGKSDFSVVCEFLQS